MDVSWDSGLCSSEARTPSPIKDKKSRRTRRHRSSDLALSSSRGKTNSPGLRPRSKSAVGNLGQMRLSIVDSTDSEGEERAIVQPGSFVLAKSVERFIEKHPAKSTDCSSDSGNEASSLNDTMLQNTAALSKPVKTFTSTATLTLTTVLTSAVSGDSVNASPTEDEEEKSNAAAGAGIDDGHFVQGWTVAERRRLFEK